MPGPAIVAESLERTFGATLAVAGVDLEVREGEIYGFLGPNGAGKSTTIDLLLGLQAPDAGSATIFGQAPSDAIAAGRVGAMLQIGGLLSNLTVRELLMMVAAFYRSPLDIDVVLELARIEDFADRRTEKLSGGQVQRARFALALVGDPELLVLDEPTAGMDVEARQAFWTTVRGLARESRTILFATHYLEEADLYADRVVLMARGRVVADGPPTEIKAMVGTRTIRATLAGVPLERLEGLPGVTSAERRGEAVVLVCVDSDATIRALLATFPEARDIEIRGAALDEAFLQLTGDGYDDGGAGGPS